MALDAVTFSVDYGELFAVVGPNGAGKSTLFNVVSGNELPSRGCVTVAERRIDLSTISERARVIGRSFQVARLVPHLSVIENVMVRLDHVHAELSEAQRLRIALDHIAAFGLADAANAPVNRLSGGQRKLVDITRAAVGDPPLVLLDEPAVGLARDELEHLKTLLYQLQARGSAIVIVEHNIDFVADVTKRGIVLDGGQTIAMGRTKDILVDLKVKEAYFGALP
jgi:ABC-type branched-subunit amino acid transport system ATPase component